jgi:hypothetical protein
MLVDSARHWAKVLEWIPHPRWTPKESYASHHRHHLCDRSTYVLLELAQIL